MANSHTSDYLSNIHSEMFMRWVEEKLVLVFEKVHPNKSMVLVVDSALYYNKRIIGPPSSLTKKRLLI